MESLQYTPLGKCTRAVLGSRTVLVQGVVVVERIETFASAVTERFLAQTLCDLVCAGVAAANDPLLVEMGALSLGGACWCGVVEVVELGLGGRASEEEWEAAIERVHGDGALLFTDGSHDESSRVSGGWWGERGGAGPWRWALWPLFGTERLRGCGWHWI